MLVLLSVLTPNGAFAKVILLPVMVYATSGSCRTPSNVIVSAAVL